MYSFPNGKLPLLHNDYIFIESRVFEKIGSWTENLDYRAHVLFANIWRLKLSFDLFF